MLKRIKPKKIKRIIIDITPEKHKEIKLAATSMGISMKAFIENALFAYSDVLKNQKENYCED